MKFYINIFIHFEFYFKIIFMIIFDFKQKINKEKQEYKHNVYIKYTNNTIISMFYYKFYKKNQ